MKKILLASTILVGSAGVAAADVSFAGAAYFGIQQDYTGVFHSEATASVTAKMSGETDGGLGFGASFGIAGGGTALDNTAWNDDFNTTGDNDFATTNTASTAGLGDVSVWISGGFGKLTAAADASDLDEVKWTYGNTWGDFSVAATYVMAPTVGTDGDWSLKGTYAAGDYSAYLGYGWDVSAAAGTVSGGGSAAFGAVSVSVGVADLSAFADTWTLGAKYTTGAVTVGIDMDAGEAGVAGSNNYQLTGAYDLGGGASVVAAYKSNTTDTDGVTRENIMSLGVKMSF